VVATYMTRLDVHVQGHAVRPEHVLTLLLVARLLHVRSTPSRERTAIVCLSLGFVAANVASTLLFAPAGGESATVISWLVLDVVLVAALLSIPEYVDVILDTGVAVSALAAFAAVSLWTLSYAGGADIGVQPDPAYGGHAAYVLSFEANTLGSSLAVWGVVAAAARRPHGRSRQVWFHLLIAAGILSSQTRAALVAYLVGLVIIGVGHRRVSITAVAVMFVSVAVLGAGGRGLPTSLAHLSNKFLYTLDVHSRDSSLRLHNASVAIKDLHGLSYVLGLGTNSFGQRHFDSSRPGEQIPAYLGILPLQLLYDSGVVGFFAAALLWLRAARFGRVTRSSTAAVTLAYLICSTATSVLWFSSTWIFLALPLMKRSVDIDKESYG
jgi:hypothetical protein